MTTRTVPAPDAAALSNVAIDSADGTVGCVADNTASITVLGLDFGERRIGVATGQTLIGTGRPLGVIHAISRADRLKYLAPYVREWSPDLLVVGRPVHPDGAAHTMTHLSERFARQVSEHYRLPFALVDERYTSVEAESSDQAAQDKHGLDALAAAAIVTQYFNEHLDRSD